MGFRLARPIGGEFRHHLFKIPGYSFS